MKRIIIFILLFFINLSTGQTASNFDISKHKVVLHKVTLGETMLIISKKYLVNPTEIYKVNKFSVDGLERGMILKIPNTSIMPEDKNRVNLNAVPDSIKSKQGLLEFPILIIFSLLKLLNTL
ncbi:LysM peptidoglycan-binding domain-containing protein [Flavobacterium sp.]|uniref:LysM peptidoglycan-binding domain-containing protein n=1 Tax=Flavobacterium sp. TaxID=239 RepID=UPI003F699A68